TSAQITISNGLVLNGFARVSNPTNNTYGVITFQGSQTLSGNGEVIFGGLNLAGYDALRLSVAGSALTLGPGITVHGKNGTLGYSPIWGGPSNVGLTNRGIIRADVAGGTISIRAQPFVNAGLLQSPAGTVDLAGTQLTSGLGVFQSAGGQVQLSGLLDNTNATLVLDGPGNVLTMAAGTLPSGSLDVTNGTDLVFVSGTLQGV